MATVHITLLTAEGCHYCAHARKIVERLTQEWPLVVEEVPLYSPEGADRALRDGIAFPPGIYLNGALFGYGRLSEGKLRRRLGELTRP
ncbi:MAG: thioredoxin family protein [Chloroflexi bacterium]|nr:thioredoxin family protein [Chloroflexota bacterium]